MEKIKFKQLSLSLKIAVIFSWLFGSALIFNIILEILGFTI